MYWLIWFGAALVLTIAEIFTVDLLFLTLALAAAAAGVTALLGVSIWVQLVVFTLTALVLLIAVRPWARRLLQSSTPDIATNAQGLVGMTAQVIAPLKGPGGRVWLQGAEWSARGEGGMTFPVGSTVRVVSIDGATAVVGPEDQQVDVPANTVPEEPTF